LPSSTPTASPTPTATPSSPPSFAEFAIPATSIADGPDGNLWVTIAGASPAIEALNTAAVVQASYPIGPYPVAIISGPQGKLWFGDGSAIESITASGTLTPFPLPTLSQVNRLTQGPDGNVWATLASEMNDGTQTIDQLNVTSGAVMLFSTDSQTNCGGSTTLSVTAPDQITSGSDGALWFTVSSESPQSGGPFRATIGRMTTNGSLTCYPLAGPLVGGNGITRNSADGNVWFTDYNAVGRITPTGAVSEYYVDGGPSYGIVAASDGSLWFLLASDDPPDAIGYSGIGHVDKTGNVLGTYQIPTQNALAGSITIGPDGNIWFTENGVGKVGRLLISADKPAKFQRSR
jgi:streptogramin lyase